MSEQDHDNWKRMVTGTLESDRVRLDGLEFRANLLQQRDQAQVQPTQVASESSRAAVLKAFLDNFASAHGRATKALVLVGYAGTFVLWDKLDGKLSAQSPTWIFASIGLLLTVSIATYSLWNIRAAYRLKRAVYLFSRRLRNIPEDGSKESERRLKAAGRSFAKVGQGVERYAPEVFVLYTGTFAVAALLELVCYMVLVG